jgi:hypothetical protein
LFSLSVTWPCKRNGTSKGCRERHRPPVLEATTRRETPHMPAIVSCTCGARVRLPETTQGRAFRCPKCKTELLATMDDKILTSTLAHGGTVGAVCPICQVSILQGDPVVTCPNCDQIHHRECWVDVGGCSTYGCRQAPVAQDKEPEQAPLSAWGDTKKCPGCGETIKSIALRCRYCGTNFNTVDPLTARDLHGQAHLELTAQKLQTVVIILFVASLFGLPGPIVLCASLGLVLTQRKAIAKAGPFYLTLAYSAVAVSGVFSVLMLLFALFSR